MPIYPMSVKNKTPRGSGEAPGQVIQKDDHENKRIISRKTGVCKGVCPVVRKNLQQARKAAGMTQQAMADKLGVGLRHYKKIECGETLGSVPLWDELEDVLGVNQRVLREIHPDTEGSQ